MRNRVSIDKEGVKVLTVTKEGKLTIYTKSPVPTKDIKARHHLQLEGEKRNAFWDFDKACSEKVKAFKAQKKKIEELVAKEQKRVMSNIDTWFHRSLKVAV